MTFTSFSSVFLLVCAFFIFEISSRHVYLWSFMFISITAVFNVMSLLKFCISIRDRNRNRKELPKWFTISQASTFMTILVTGIMIKAKIEWFFWLILIYFLCGPFFILRHCHKVIEKWVNQSTTSR